MSATRRLALRMVLLGILPAGVIAGGLWLYLQGGRYVSTENAYVKADIVQVSAEVEGQVVEVRVRDQTPVEAGDLLFRLDPEPFRLALARAEAELGAARQQVETMRAAWREAKGELADAEDQTAYLARQAERQRSLAQSGAASVIKREEADNAANSARDKVIVLRHRVGRMLAALGGDPDIVTDAHPLVREKLAARDKAALDLARTVVKAPMAGTAASVKLQPGEHVRAGTPLFVVVAATRPWVEANLKETELTDVRVGQRATVVLDGFPAFTWEAEVASISPATGAEFSILPPQNASGNWVKVVQRLPVRLTLTPRAGEPPLRAGTTATISIDTARRRTLAELFGWIASAAPEPSREPAR